VTYIAIVSKFSHDSDSDYRREVAVNDGQYLKLPATFHIFLLSTSQRRCLKCIILGHNFSITWFLSRLFLV